MCGCKSCGQMKKDQQSENLSSRLTLPVAAGKKKGRKMEIRLYNHTLQILYFSFLPRINSSNKFSLHLCEALQIEPQKQKLITF